MRSVRALLVSRLVSRIPRPMAAILLTAALIVAAPAPSAAAASTVVGVTRSCSTAVAYNIRSAPNATSTVLMTAAMGAKVTVDPAAVAGSAWGPFGCASPTSGTGWYHVYAVGSIAVNGYIYAGAVSLPAPAPTQIAAVTRSCPTATSYNVRSTPSASGSLVKVIGMGARITVGATPVTGGAWGPFACASPASGTGWYRVYAIGSTAVNGYIYAGGVIAPAPSSATSPCAASPAPGAGWITGSVAVVTQPGTQGTIEAHLGNAFPVTLTGKCGALGGVNWYEFVWATPSRRMTGWVAATSIVRTKPAGRANASIDALDVDLAAYLSRIGARVGVQVLDYSRGTVYSYNATRYYTVASSMKVPIMLTLLWQLEKQGRGPNSTELSLLTTMIENSNNASASALYQEIGYQAGINSFMSAVGVSGLNPAAPSTGWGWSTMQPAAMVALLDKLHAGTILNASDRALAIRLMENVESDQRVGVGDTAPAGATVALKDGWVTGPDGYMVMNSSGIVMLPTETYIISVYTIDDASLQQGFDIVRHICYVIGQRLTS